MAKRIDWMDFAHQLDKEREAMRDRMPPGVDLWVTLRCYGFCPAEFTVHLSHRETELDGYGTGRTPAKAMEAARADLAKKVAEQQSRPRLVAAEPRPLPPAGPRTLFPEDS